MTALFWRTFSAHFFDTAHFLSALFSPAHFLNTAQFSGALF